MAPSPNSKKRQRDDSPANGEEPLSDKAIEELAKAGATFDTDRVPKRQRVEATRSLFVRSLPPSATNETLTEFFSQHYPVKHSTVVVDQKTKASRGYGFVTFADPDDAKDAKDKLDSVVWEGRKLRLDVAEPRHRAKDSKPEVDGAKEKRKAMLEEARRPAKLIVRNLPWSVKKPEHLAALFQSFGKVRYADLPNANGKLKGFGFVTMRRRKHAQKALETVNEKEVDGRTLVVDWAVDKQTWEGQSQEGTKPGANESKDKEAKAKEESTGKKDKTKENGKQEDTKPKAKAPEKESTSTADEDVAAFFANHMDNLESESDTDDMDEEEDEADDPGQDDEDEDDEHRGKKTPESHPAKRLTTDNSSTVFIRNLPYTATDEQLKDFFSHFGFVRYARVVMDKATDRPAGTGFVCFSRQEDCKACIKGAPRHQPNQVGGSKITHSVLHDETVDPEGKYTLDGRVLQVAQAVSKDETARFSKDGDKNKDKRRLFLLSEGVITNSSPLHSLLSPAEIRMRDASLAQRKKLVQRNPTLHLSLTRLAIRNIPRNMTPKDLKELARKSVVGFAVDVKAGRREPLSQEEKARGGEEAKAAEHERKLKNKGLVKQAKLVFETKDGSKAPATEGSKSRGYGFIEYWSHRSALMALRFLNGHEQVDDRGKKQRLIAEFSIENAQVVNRRNTLQAKSREAAQRGPEEPAGPENTNGPASWNPRGKGPHDKKGKLQKGGKGESRDGKGNKNNGVQSKAERKEGQQDDVKQKLIARKRMVRKKKAGARS